MNRHLVVAMRKHSSKVEVDGVVVHIELPKGCTGLLFCFESKKAACAYWGKDVLMKRIEREVAE